MSVPFPIFAIILGRLITRPSGQNNLRQRVGSENKSATNARMGHIRSAVPPESGSSPTLNLLMSKGVLYPSLPFPVSPPCDLGDLRVKKTRVSGKVSQKLCCMCGILCDRQHYATIKNKLPAGSIGWAIFDK